MNWVKIGAMLVLGVVLVGAVGSVWNALSDSIAEFNGSLWGEFLGTGVMSDGSAYLSAVPWALLLTIIVAAFTVRVVYAILRWVSS